MNKKTNNEMQALVDKATAGDKKALETLVAGVRILYSICPCGCWVHLQMRKMPLRISC